MLVIEFVYRWMAKVNLARLRKLLGSPAPPCHITFSVRDINLLFFYVSTRLNNNKTDIFYYLDVSKLDISTSFVDIGHEEVSIFKFSLRQLAEIL